MPTLRSVSSPTATVPAAFDVEPNRSGSTWHCLNCESADAEPVLGGWQCTQCGSQEFYDPNLPLRSVTARGTWMYMPHGSPEMASPSSSASASSQASRRRRRRRGPPSGNPESDAGERAESEAPTVDPIVVPSEHDSNCTQVADDRSGLTVESQRLVLIGTSQSLELETIAEALTLQYPDFRGAPPIAGRDGKGAPKGSKSSTSSSTASSLGKGSSTSSRSASPL